MYEKCGFVKRTRVLERIRSFLAGWTSPDRVMGMESIQMGTQRYTDKAQRATEFFSVKLCVSSVLSVFLPISSILETTFQIKGST